MSLQIRRARTRDLMLMQDCNLTCLPENYQFRYYLFHYASWGEDLYVVEDKPDHIVGYVLAKMEDDYDSQKKKESVEEVSANGHITSLSVFRTYRKLKLATKLMNCAHASLKESFGCKYVSLHVRKSNTAAIHLYTKTMGYVDNGLESGYYNDGEDALKLRLFFDKKLNREKQDEAEEKRLRNSTDKSKSSHSNRNSNRNKKKKKKKKKRRR